MKVLFVVVAVALLALVASEQCRQGATDCKITACVSTSQLVCHNHECTCESTGGSSGNNCIAKADCHCTHGGDSAAHCVDGKCRCFHRD